MSGASSPPLQCGLAPVFNDATRVLILGSFPGEASLQAAQYYAHPRNQFWPLMAELTSVALPKMDYLVRLQALLQHGIGLWDVVAQAQRKGSLDSNIRKHVHTELATFANELPALVAIAFNGGTAARLGAKALQEQAGRYHIVNLPSSSPAYTLPFAEKLHAWRALQPWIASAADTKPS